MTLVGLILEVHHHLERAGLSHAFGGALALAYIGQPRATADVDVNVFVPVVEVDTVLSAFEALELRPEADRAAWLPAAGIRLRRPADPFPVDLFLSLDDRYGAIEQRCVVRPFGADGTALPFLSAEDLTLFKLSFGRDKDWVDIRTIAAARPDLDVGYIEDQLVALRGPHMHPRLARLRALLSNPR